MSFNEAQLQGILDHVGNHSTMDIPEDYEHRLCFGMLEMIDYQCYQYEHVPEGVTYNSLVKYLLANGDTARECQPPSMLGFITGRFNFLTEQEVNHGTE